jgi:hypothetical protein
MGHHEWYLLSFRRIAAVIVPTDGGAGRGRMRCRRSHKAHMQLRHKPIKKKRPGGGGISTIMQFFIYLITLLHIL